ncbi:MAG: radical SAM protein [Thermodesulfobacteriota bacterium]
MRVLLAYPAFADARLREDDMSALPMGMVALGAELSRAGHRVLLCDWHRSDPADMEKELLSFAPEVLGFSVLNGNRHAALSAAARARRLLPGVTVVLGGVGATMLWELLLSYPQVDYVILGEADRSLPALVSCLEQKDSEALAKIPGLAFCRNGSAFLAAKPAPVSDLSSLARPWELYTYRHVALSRGCPGACAYCGSPRFWGRRVRFREPEDFVSEILALNRKGVSFFYFSDDTFTLDRERVRAVCRGIIARGLTIRFNAICRPENTDAEILSLLRRAGCIQLSFGVESADEKVLAALGKKVSRKNLLAAFRLCRETGILPRAYFMYGCPGDSPDTMEQNCRLMDELRPLSAVFYLLTLFPGTRLYDDWKKRSGETDDIWRGPLEDIPYCRTDPSLPDEAVFAFGDTLRGHFFKNLPSYALSLAPPGDPELAIFHAEFLCRLAMTFAFGDLAENPAVPTKEQTAATLFSRSLRAVPLSDAYLGLGVLLQKCGDRNGGTRVLEEGLSRFPGDAELARALSAGAENGRSG